MSRLIDADALIEFCAERWIPLNIDAVNMQPTIQPEKAQLSKEGTTSDMISREAVIDLLKQMRKDGDMVPWEGKNVFARIRKLPSAQPELIEKTAYIRGFEQGRTQGMIDSQGGRNE